MRGIVIEQGDGYRVESFGNGLSYTITQEATGNDVFIQGDDASMWRDEYDGLYADHSKPNTRASRFTWRQLLDTMCGPYFH